MDTLEAILSRRSIRKYSSEAVTEEDVRALLEAAMAAPSAGNEQPWQFVVITARATLEQIPSFHEYSKMLYEAPLAVLVCGDQRLKKYESFWVQDCAAATQAARINGKRPENCAVVRSGWCRGKTLWGLGF